MTAAPNQSFALIPASYVYLRRGDEVLLQRRAGTGYMDGHWVAGAAGHIEPRETAQAAAVREAMEELGVTIAPGALEALTVMHRTDGTSNPREQRVDWFWTSTEWTGTPRIIEPNKCSGLGWFQMTALPDPMPDYERAVLIPWARNALPVTTTHGFLTSDS
ncbi:NUDIX domain-containing protein [Allobranchiibius sp. GilTou73]|uniref:NUDIX hydrolase n=1 Tax=Allobranchiibius sp. GilTou73 TaxID=2904523 RepID=UPI001F410252|nr:NUDIX domain-containing protein [Allobranchiibius sp. GilTou73]UIJ33945.1 NUDIX domain-containing protein [Allobranchiibius sp. GilTou73]